MGVVLFLLGYTELVQLLLYSGFNPRQRDDLNQVNLIDLHCNMFIFFYLFQIPFVSDDLAWKEEAVFKVYYFNVFLFHLSQRMVIGNRVRGKRAR